MSGRTQRHKNTLPDTPISDRVGEAKANEIASASMGGVLAHLPGMRKTRRDTTVKLYKCETIAQFKIGMWLVEQGIEREDILTAELLGPNEVKITNPTGQYMHIRWMGDHAEIV